MDNILYTSAPAVPAYEDAVKVLGMGQAQRLSADIFGTGHGLNATGPAGTGGLTVPQLLGQAANGTYNQLNPNTQQTFADASASAASGLNGNAQRAAGGDAARAALGNQVGAARAVAGAGQDTRAAVNGNMLVTAGVNAQTLQDLNMQRGIAAGTQDSAGVLAARQQLQQGIQSQYQLAAAARGGNVGAAQRAASDAATQQQLSAQPLIAAQRAQDQLTAQQQLVQGGAGLSSQVNNTIGAANGARTNDINQAVGSAQALNDAGATASANFGVGSQLAAQGLQQQGQLASTYANSMVQQQQAQRQAELDYSNWLQQQYAIASGLSVQTGGINGQVQQANRATNAQLQGGAISTAAALAAL